MVWIQIGSGIRQGCPLSGSLWPIAFDIVIKYIASSFRDETFLLRAYADDILALLLNIDEMAPILFSCFDVVALATHLKLNLKKLNFARFLMLTTRHTGDTLPHSCILSRILWCEGMSRLLASFSDRKRHKLYGLMFV